MISLGYAVRLSCFLLVSRQENLRDVRVHTYLVDCNTSSQAPM